MERDGAAASAAGERAGAPSMRIPGAPPPLVSPPIDVGTYPARSVEAEDFARRIGNWGTAARDIGDRWEVVGLDRLRERLPWTLLVGGGRAMRVDRVVRLDSGDAGVALQRAGVSAPDLVLVGTVATGNGPRVALRAADLKVSLDTAEGPQTAPARLQAAFARVAASMPSASQSILAEARGHDGADPLAAPVIARALAGDWADLALVEGVYVAPDTGFNRWFLQEVEHRRRAGRAGPRLPFRGRRRAEAGAGAAPSGLPAHLEPVAASDFLGTLAGWPEAGVVAELDGIGLASIDPAVAERCWRVGNGLRGALLSIRRRLFEPASELRDAAGAAVDVVRVLRGVAARDGGRSAALVRAVADALDRRRAAWDDEARVLAFPVGYDTWASLYGAARRAHADEGTVDPTLAGSFATSGLDAGSVEASPDDDARRLFARSCRNAHRGAAQRHRLRVIAAARAAYLDGMDEVATLELLRSRLGAWVEAARADAARPDPAAEPAGE